MADAGARRSVIFGRSDAPVHPRPARVQSTRAQVVARHHRRLIQGVELVNGRTFYEGAFPWIREKNLAIFANSDVHRLISIDYGPRERPVTLVFAASASLFAEYNVTSNLGFRVAPEYVPTGFGSTVQNNLGYTASLVYRFGKQ